MFKELYKQELLDHYYNPRNCGTIDNPDFCSKEYNPSCGDRIIIQGTVDEKGCIKKSTFQGSGCVLSQATASILTEWSKGKEIKLIAQCTEKDVQSLIAIPIGITRLKCVMLSLYALQSGINEYRRNKE